MKARLVRLWREELESWPGVQSAGGSDFGRSCAAQLGVTPQCSALTLWQVPWGPAGDATEEWG